MKKEYKDLKVKIGSKEEAAWTRIKERVETELEEYKRLIIINEHVLKLADDMINKEHKEWLKAS